MSAFAVPAALQMSITIQLNILAVPGQLCYHALQVC